MEAIRIVLADDHTLVRAGIRALLESLEGVQVVAEANDGNEALQLAKIHNPDILITDISMPLVNGLEVAEQLSKNLPEIRIIILSMHTDQEYVAQALRSGASGYLLKRSAIAELELAVHSVANGQNYLSPKISKQVVEGFIKRHEIEDNPLAKLTPRQQQILEFVAQGHNTKEMAYRLKVSTKTIESHRLQLMERLEIHNISGLVRFAIRIGLVNTDT